MVIAKKKPVAIAIVTGKKCRTATVERSRV